MEKLLIVKVQAEGKLVRVNIADYRNNPNSPDVNQYYLGNAHTPESVCAAIYSLIDKLLED